MHNIQQYVARSSGTENMLDLVTASLLEGSNSFLNGSSLACTEIEKAYRLISLLEILNSLNVTFCKVNDMNIITDACAVSVL